MSLCARDAKGLALAPFRREAVAKRSLKQPGSEAENGKS